MKAVKKNIGKLRRGQRNLPRPNSHTNLKTVRENIDSSTASTNSDHFEIREITNDMEGTLDTNENQFTIHRITTEYT